MTITAILAATLFVPQALPEPPVTTGSLMDKPISILRNDEAELYVAQPGGAPVQMGTVDPKFWMNNILDPDLPSQYRINSFSRGTGVILTSVDGVGRIILAVPSGGWSFIVYGVDNADGNPWPDGIYKAEADAEGGVLGDTFGFVADGSWAAFPPEEIDVIMKFRDGLELGATSLRGLDTYMPGWFLSGEIPEDIGLEGALFFFTVVHTDPGATEPSDYLDIPQDWGPLGNDWKGPATIFSVEYKNGAWKTPTVFKRAGQSGLFLHENDDDTQPMTVIDGLSVQDNDSGAEVILSTSGSDPMLQLWAAGWWPTGVGGALQFHSGPLRADGGELYVTTKLNIPPGKGIRSICNDDPKGILATPPPERHVAFCTRTSLVDTLFLGNSRFGIAAHRLPAPGTAPDVYRFILQGSATSRDYVAQLIQIGISSNQIVGTVPRDPRLGADRRTLTVSVPRGLSGSKQSFQWEIFDSRGILLGRSHRFYFYLD